MDGKCQGYKKNGCGQEIIYQSLCKNCLGKKFEYDVAELFELMGFEVERDLLISGRQVDMYISYTMGIASIRGIVECKYHINNTVGADDVGQVLSSASPLIRDGKIEKVFLITTKGFTSHAKKNAEDNRIECYTYDQMLSKIIDFKPYLKNIVKTFEEGPLFHSYVDLYCKRYQKVNKKKYDWCFVKKRMTGYLKRWLELPNQNHISILGDIGAGKTSLCRYFNYLIAKRHLKDPIRYPRIPLLINLSNFARLENKNVQAIITDYLVNELGITINYNTFIKVMKLGKFVLILDGFDEMAMKVDQNVRNGNFKYLAELSISPNKVILTGRPGYFPDLNEMRRIMGHISESNDPYDTIEINLSKKISEKPVYDIVNLLPFYSKQINNFLSKQRKKIEALGFNDLDKIRRIIKDTYNLEDLSKRPVLLDIIVETIPTLTIPKFERKVQNVDIFRLYTIYTKKWLDLDWEKGEMRRLLKNVDRLLFMKELAFELYINNLQVIHYTKLPKQIRKVFEIEKNSDIDYFEHDIRTCTFLNRSDDGHYGFIHKSFMEYFTATKIIDEKNNISNLFESISLSEGVIEFFSSAINENDLNDFLEYIRSKNNKLLNENVLKIWLNKKKGKLVGLNLKNCSFEGIVFSNCIFEKCIFDNSIFKKCLLSQIEFVECSLDSVIFLDSKIGAKFSVPIENTASWKTNICHKSVIFKNCILDRSNFGDSYLNGVKFVSCSMKSVDFRKHELSRFSRTAGFKQIYFEHSNLKKSLFEGRSFISSYFIDASMSKAKLQNTFFVQCSFKKSRFDRTNLNGSCFRECNLYDAHFSHSYMRRIKFGTFELAKPDSKPQNTFNLKFKSNNFSGTLIEKSNLRESMMINQILKGATILDNNMKETQIIGTVFISCSIKQINFRGSRIIGTKCVESKGEENNFEDTHLIRSNLAGILK